MLKIDRLNLKINHKTILKELSVEFRASEIHVITGLSGAGKSQFLRTLAHLNCAHTDFKQDLKTNIVFQENNLIPWLTLKQNLEVTKQFTNTEIDQLFSDVNLEKHKNSKPHEVSGGMQQRVSLIRALSKDCKLLLLDEPFSKLDLANKQQNYQLLLKIFNKYKPLIVFVTHDIDEALYFADRISILSKKTQNIIHTEQINFERPRNFLNIKHDSQFKIIFEQIHQIITTDYSNEKN